MPPRRHRREYFFTWRRPSQCIDWWPDNRRALPPVQNQHFEELCIVFATVACLQSRLNIEAARNNHPPPRRLSLAYVTDAVQAMDGLVTISRVLDWVVENGVVTEADYNEARENGQPIAEDVWRLRVEMWHGLDPELEGFDTFVIRQMSEWGPLIGEFVERTDFDRTGRRLYWAMGQPVEIINRAELGHAIVLEGWGYDPNEIAWFWEYMNSHGTSFGVGGFAPVEVRALHWAYAPMIIYDL